MKKTIHVAGRQAKLTGEIEIIFNFRTEVKEVHNRVLHDEIPTRITYHRVQVTQPGNAAMSIKAIEFTNRDEAPRHAEEIEKQLYNYLMIIADSDKQKTTEERLKTMGYK